MKIELEQKKTLLAQSMIMLPYITIAGIFIYYLKNIDKNQECWAFSDNSTAFPSKKEALKHTGTDLQNVTLNFRIMMYLIVISSLSDVIRCFLNQVYAFKATKFLLYSIRALYLIYLLEIIIFICIGVLRFSNPGQVCSGDFASDNGLNLQPPYIHQTGKILRELFSCVAIVLLITSLSAVLLTFMKFVLHWYEKFQKRLSKTKGGKGFQINQDSQASEVESRV